MGKKEKIVKANFDGEKNTKKVNNFGFFGTQKSRKKPVPETQNVAANAQDALNSQGRAFINMSKTTLKGQTSDNKLTPEIPHYSEEEKKEKINSIPTFLGFKLSDEELQTALQMDDIHFDRLIKYANHHNYCKNAYKIATMDDDKYSKFEIFESIKYSHIKAKDILEFIEEKGDSPEFDAIKSVIDEYGEEVVFRDIDKLVECSMLTDDEKTRFNETLKACGGYNMEAATILDIAKLEPEKYNRVLDLIKFGIANYCAIKAVDFNEQQIKTFKDFKKIGIDDYYSVEMAKKCGDNSEISSYIINITPFLLSKGVQSYGISKLADLDSTIKLEQYKRFLNIASEKDIKSGYIIDIASQEPKSFERAYKMLELDSGNIDIYNIKDIMELNPQRQKDIIEMLEKGFKPSSTFYYSYKQLNDTEAQQYKRIFELGLCQGETDIESTLLAKTPPEQFKIIESLATSKTITKLIESDSKQAIGNIYRYVYVGILSDEEKANALINLFNNENFANLMIKTQTRIEDYDENLAIVLGMTESQIASAKKNNEQNSLWSLDISSILDIISAQDLDTLNNMISNENFLNIIRTGKMSVYQIKDIIKIPGIGNLIQNKKLSYIFDRFQLDKYSIEDLANLDKSQIERYESLGQNIKIQNYIKEHDCYTLNQLKPLSLIPEEGLENFDKLIESIEAQTKKMLNNPKLYVNGEFEAEGEAQNAINIFVKNNSEKLLLLSSIFDKEAVNSLLRMRFDNAEEYLDMLTDLKPQDIQLLKDMANSCNIDGKPLMPTQKIELIDLIQGYRDNNLDMTKIEEMVKSGRIDIAQLNLDLFKGILKNCGLSDDEISQIPIEKLTSWDTRYAHMLSKEINDTDSNNSLIDLIRASNLDDFRRYIQDEENKYGKVNSKTKEEFNKKGMNYDAWLNPSEDNNIQFKMKDKNLEKLEQISLQIIEDIENLRKTPIKGFIDKQFPKCIKGDEFVIPNEYLGSKAKLEEFVNNVLNQLEPVFKRAEGNLDNPSKVQVAQNTLTIRDHLNQRLDDISKISDESNSTKTLDLTIKMWDRIPPKDIFQGNYSTCCIGMGGGNGSAMPHYLLDTSYNMIELVDNQTGKIIGNALCYFIEEDNGKPAFIIDNIEIRNSVKPSYEIGKELRNNIVQYASNIAREVVGSDNVNIYMSSNYNDVPCDDLEATDKKVEFLGDIDCDQIYMDLYGGWVNKNELSGKNKLLKLK